MTRRLRVACFGEAVTLAHASRPAFLSRTLDPNRYETWLITDPRYRNLLGKTEHFVPLRSLSPETFVERLARGAPIFDPEYLTNAVHEDRKILKELEPDLVLGDLRVSLSISARLLSIPYVAIVDSYWSPYAQRSYPLPDLPIRRLGNRLAEALFRQFHPLGFALHARSIDRVRRRFGLPSVHGDLCRAYTDADYVVYPDIPEFIHKEPLPSTHHHVGPIVFQPEVPLPEWWNELGDRPCIYLSLGTSGRGDLLPEIVDALGELPIDLMIATADDRRLDIHTRSARVFTAHFLPGHLAAMRSDLVICNGGSGTTQQALCAGTPILGIASNMDQLMNMESMTNMGAGLCLGTWEMNSLRLLRATERLLEEPSFRQSAARLQSLLARVDPADAMPRIVDEIMAKRNRTSLRATAHAWKEMLE